MAKKEKYYTLDRVLSFNSLYIVLFGERANGKSYAVKKRCLEKAFVYNEKFVYMRRWREDIMNNGAEEYWDDMEINDEGKREIFDMTDGKYDCVSIYKGGIFFATRNEEGKKERGIQIGKIVVLTGDTHYKSRSYVGYKRIIFEEFITTSGYLVDEVRTFMSIVSTVLRRRQGEVFLIGNTLTIQCPYFREWQLVGVPKQKQGSIDIYKYHTNEFDENGEEIIVDIACQYCENTEGVTRMIFGNKMISTGEWETDEKPHLSEPYGKYKRHLSILVTDELELFAIDLLSYEHNPLLFIRVIDKKWTSYEKYDIVLTNRFFYERKYAKNLAAFPRVCSIVRRLYDSGKVCYEDNLVGTTFETLLLNRPLF